jgi:hypothetical protein
MNWGDSFIQIFSAADASKNTWIQPQMYFTISRTKKGHSGNCALANKQNQLKTKYLSLPINYRDTSWPFAILPACCGGVPLPNKELNLHPAGPRDCFISNSNHPQSHKKCGRWLKGPSNSYRNWSIEVLPVRQSEAKASSPAEERCFPLRCDDSVGWAGGLLSFSW